MKTVCIIETLAGPILAASLSSEGIAQSEQSHLKARACLMIKSQHTSQATFLWHNKQELAGHLAILTTPDSPASHSSLNLKLGSEIKALGIPFEHPYPSCPEAVKLKLSCHTGTMVANGSPADAEPEAAEAAACCACAREILADPKADSMDRLTWSGSGAPSKTPRAACIAL